MARVGIPTYIHSRRYRSRLEARWAAFFDRMGWPYEYEPFDLAGWIPDFVLYGHRGPYPQEILVEIKPTMNKLEFPIEKIARAIQQSYAPKIWPESWWEGVWTEKPLDPYPDMNNPQVLLLGSTICENSPFGYNSPGDGNSLLAQIGWLIDAFWDLTTPLPATTITKTLSPMVIVRGMNGYDFTNDEEDYNEDLHEGIYPSNYLRITGQEWETCDAADFDQIKALWNQAGNEVQWRK